MFARFSQLVCNQVLQLPELERHHLPVAVLRDHMGIISVRLDIDQPCRGYPQQLRSGRYDDVRVQCFSLIDDKVTLFSGYAARAFRNLYEMNGYRMNSVFSELAQEVLEDFRLAGEGKEEAVHGTPEVRRVADVVGIAPRHVPAIDQIQRRKDIGRYGNGNQVDVDSHLRIEQDGGEEDGGNCARCADSIVGDVILVLEQIAE